MDLPVCYKDLTPEEKYIVREKYIQLQKGLCHYCGEDLSGEPRKDVLQKKVERKWFPKGFFNNPIHLHHSHDDGLTIGVVHCYCNAVLWIYHGE